MVTMILENPTVEEDLKLTPPITGGKEYLYGWYPPANAQFATPGYKLMTSKEDESRLSAHIVPPRPVSSKPSTGPLQHPTQSQQQQLLRSMSATPAGMTNGQTTPCIIKPGRKEKDGRPALSAKMDAIRRDLARRQKEAPLVRLLSAQVRQGTGGSLQGKAVSRPLFGGVPSGWRPRYPEPNFRTPPPSTEEAASFSESITSSLRQSVSLPTPPEVEPLANQKEAADAQLSVFERPVAPAPGPSESSRGSCEHVSRRIRPKTAPATLRKPPVVVETVAHPQTELELCLKGRRIQSAQPRRRFGVPKATLMEAPSPPSPPPPLAMTQTAEAAEDRTIIVQPKVEAWAEEKGEFGGEKIVHMLEDEYDRALKKYGWRLEIQNDPLGLKRPLLSKRLAYTVEMPIPDVLPLPPPMRKENRETFFHTSLPRTVYSFDINPDFMSERYNAARDAMRKKGQWNYANKDFSFVY